MRYIDETCPYCGQSFAEGDDVVVCPGCGTPHHRGCWVAHGCCANEAKHAEGFVWKKTAPAAAPVQEEPEKENNKKSLDIVCPDCGTVSPNGTLRCPKCGAMLIPFAPMGIGEPPLAQFRSGFDANEDISGLKSGDVALFCRVGGARYIKAFKKLAAGRKLGWNWGAALFGPIWFFYRKLYKPGLIFMALYMAINLWMLPLSAEFTEAYYTAMGEATHAQENSGDKDGTQEFYEVMDKHMPTIVEKMIPVYFPMLAMLLLNIASALAADKLYWRKAKADITAVRNEENDERMVQLGLFQKGGTSVFAAFGVYLANRALLYLASFLMSR